MLGLAENYEESLKHFEEASNIDRNFPAFFCKGMCLYFLEDYDKSLAAFGEAQEFGESEDMWYY
ncbi:hypothetical protein [Methanobacterium oryzae]|uniref:hypothetical protein n=1 Tax=Methanobacterium oryzae TaxID=69540 RepID=UPI003D2580D0